MGNLTLEEQETCFNIIASDRSKVHVFTDDPVWIARLDKVSEAVRNTGEGKEYILRIEQLVVRKGKKHMSDEQRAAMSERMRKLRSVQGTT